MQSPKKENFFPYPDRYCWLFISAKFKHILFVPLGRIDIGAHVELDNLLSDDWPCNIGKLQSNIEETLNRYLPSTVHVKGQWPSYNNSKAKSQRSFEFDYISIWVATDNSKGYRGGEAERIKISCYPTSLETYSLVGIRHLVDTQVAQMVIDIFEGSSKIKY